MKEESFPFQSKDFYEGTRTMKPELRGCYVDLMIYQQQHGYVPDNMDDMAMYCTGCSPEHVLTVLQQKFIKNEKGWYNQRMRDILEEREAYTGCQSINGRVGQFWKKARAILSKKQLEALKNHCHEFSKTELIEMIGGRNIDKALLMGMLEETPAEGSPTKTPAAYTQQVIMDPDFIPIVQEWLKYKKDRRESYKSESSVVKFYRQLQELSGGDPVKAQKIIDKSMSNNYAGIFELKDDAGVKKGKLLTYNEVCVEWGNGVKPECFEKEIIRGITYFRRKEGM